MRELRVSRRADPAFVQAFERLLGEFVRTISRSERKVDLPMRMYLAGGTAVHFYTGVRLSDDVDAVFSDKILIPADMTVIYKDRDGTARSVHFDPNYNETYALLHEDAHHDAPPLKLENVDSTIVRVHMLRPLDLAVSKMARFSEIDRGDIQELARSGLIDAAGLRERATEALSYFVGDPAAVRTSIDIACRDIAGLGRSAT